MDDRERARYNCFRRIRDFGAAHHDKFPEGNFAGQMFIQMGEVVTTLEQFETTQVSSAGGAHQSTTTKAVKRNGLSASLEAISRTAHAMAMDNPGLEDKFRRPRHRTDQEILSKARAFLADAQPLSVEFVKYGLPSFFLVELQEQIYEFELATSERHTRVQSGVSATAELDDSIEDGLRLRRQLDAVVRNIARNESGILAAWETASHIERQSRPADSGEPTPPTPPAPPTPPGV